MGFLLKILIITIVLGWALRKIVAQLGARPAHTDAAETPVVKMTACRRCGVHHLRSALINGVCPSCLKRDSAE